MSSSIITLHFSKSQNGMNWSNQKEPWQYNHSNNQKSHKTKPEFKIRNQQTDPLTEKYQAQVPNRKLYNSKSKNQKPKEDTQ